MADSITARCRASNPRYAAGQAVHQPARPGPQPIQPARRLAVVGCMDARLDVEDLLGVQTGGAHIVRNAGGVVADDAIRCLIISHDLLGTGLEGDPAAGKLLGQAAGRAFMGCGRCASTPSAFHALRGAIEPLDAPRDEKNGEPDAVTVRRFIDDVDTGRLEEVSDPGPMGSFG